MQESPELSAAVMHQRANGVSITDLESRWSISGLAGIEESWRDTMLWLISGVEQIKDVKRYLRDIRYQGYELMG